jgi:16S rRNA (cytosine1402-N4)-methyltransferase
VAGFRHTSVLADELLGFLRVKPGGIYVDGTVGGGGHSRQILEASSPGGILIGFDRDREALNAALENLSSFGNRVRLIHGNFSGLFEVLSSQGISAVDGVVMDLGVSSHQLDTGERGFSFQQDAPLDMRMDTSAPLNAEEVVNGLPERELERIIKEFGEERWARRIASAIVSRREIETIKTTFQLVDVIKGAIPRAKWEPRLHPATRTFQAIRIKVNDELSSLEKGLHGGVSVLRSGGRIVVISFHSLEDRIVKNVFNELARGCVCPKQAPICVCGKTPMLKKVTGKPVTAGPVELSGNPRSRSAKLRAAEKL